MISVREAKLLTNKTVVAVSQQIGNKMQVLKVFLTTQTGDKYPRNLIIIIYRTAEIDYTFFASLPATFTDLYCRC